MQQAQVLLKSRADGVSSGLPLITDSKFLARYQPQVEILRKEVNGMLTSWKQVIYQKVTQATTYTSISLNRHTKHTHIYTHTHIHIHTHIYTHRIIT